MSVVYAFQFIFSFSFFDEEECLLEYDSIHFVIAFQIACSEARQDPFNAYGLAVSAVYPNFMHLFLSYRTPLCVK